MGGGGGLRKVIRRTCDVECKSRVVTIANPDNPAARYAHFIYITLLLRLPSFIEAAYAFFARLSGVLLRRTLSAANVVYVTRNVSLADDDGACAARKLRNNRHIMCGKFERF